MKKIYTNKKLLSFLQKTRLKNILSDKLYLQIKYKKDYGRSINWKSPSRFDEKLQWLKLYYRNPLMCKLVDKYEVKSYVANIIGEEYIIPTLNVYNSFNDIDFSLLPDKFVLKCTHDSGGLIICRDKDQLNIKDAKIKIENSLKKNFYYLMREWPYKYVRPRIIAEKFICENGKLDLTDYKFYCFNGKPKYCQLINNRSSIETIDFYDENWIHQDFVGLNPKCKNSPNYKNIPKPINYELMIELAKKLSKEFPFVRVDFYNLSGKIYFGELTFFPAGGFGYFTPEEWNYKLGKLIVLPEKL